MTEIEAHGATPFDVVLPDLMLPTQFEDARRNSHARPPEVRLIVAVLEDAVRCYRRYLNGTRPRARCIFRETDEWFAADEPEEPFSFVSICAILVIDPEAFRAGLQRQPAPRQARAAAATRSAPSQTRRIAGDRHVVTELRTRPLRGRVVQSRSAANVGGCTEGSTR
jgi:hypothetical protein